VVVDRRSPDPINVLGRELNLLCREVADPLDLAAHLEALGYTRPRIQREFGLNSSFELAERLFARTERLRRLIPAPEVPGVRGEPSWAGRILLNVVVPVGLALLVGFSGWWMLALWLGVWSQVGSALWWRIRGESDGLQMRGFVSLLLLVGVLGVGVCAWLEPAHLGVAVLGLGWVTLIALVWQGAWLWMVPLLGILGLSLYWRLPLHWTLVLVALTALLSYWRFWAWPGREILMGLRPHLRLVLPQALYGLGRVVLLLALLQGGNLKVLLGVLVLGAMLALAEAQRGWFKAHLTALLWQEDTPQRFREGALATVARYLSQMSVVLLGVLALAALGGPSNPWFYYMVGCAFLGFALALGSLQMNLEQMWWPALILLLCGGAALYRVPFALAVFVAIVLLGVGLVLRLPRVHLYAGRLV
jgi:hypothetical protein